MSARSPSPDADELPSGSPGPVRTCIGCRARERTTELFRVVAVNGVVVPDPRQRLSGRGAWLHPDPGCLAIAERRRAFGRALRRAEPLDTSTIRRFLDDRESNGRSTEQGAGPRTADSPDSPSTTGKQVDPS
jgi:uncharacterized protein